MSVHLNYHRSARTSPTFYVILALGLIFALGTLALDPAKHCVEYACPLWLRALGVGLGLLFSVGALNAIMKDFQFGSRLDVEKRALVWWEGIPPVQEQAILMDRVKAVVIDSFSDNHRLYFLDVHGESIRISNQCIPTPYDQWAAEVKRLFPHVEIQEK
ncbi:MAG: hypothetical protein ACOYYJ_15265 [Chloroflexota bacterium]